MNCFTRWLLISGLLIPGSIPAETRGVTNARQDSYLNSATSADCVVTVNEVMYHPLGQEAGLEWVDLHNQMAVDEDLSDWTLEGGIQYRFPKGTVIRARGYLVVAANPT